MYKVKEIYYTIQGEGFHTGRSAIFCRFSGCNLWSGLEKDRHKAICQFCDTDFWGTDGINGGRYDLETLVAKFDELWPDKTTLKFIVFTGGEPALQLDEEIIEYLHRNNYYIAIETNGTTKLAKGIDWICMSPKAGTLLKVRSGNELKFVFPQKGLEAKQLEELDFDHFYIQPMDGQEILQNTNAAISYCKQNPRWKLSLQTHKLIGLP